MHFRKSGRHNDTPLCISGEAVEMVSSLKLLDLTVTDKLSSTTHTTAVIRKSQQRLGNLRRLGKLLVNFCYCAVGSVLTCIFLGWFSSRTKVDQQALQRVIKATGKIIRSQLPDISTIYDSCCPGQVYSIIKD